MISRRQQKKLKMMITFSDQMMRNLYPVAEMQNVRHSCTQKMQAKIFLLSISFLRTKKEVLLKFSTALPGRLPELNIWKTDIPKGQYKAIIVIAFKKEKLFHN